MPELMTFFVVIIAGLFFSHLFNRLHLPWVVALIVAGIAIGPGGLDIYEPNNTFEILGEIGLIFLMFMAGLETEFSSFHKVQNKILPIFLLNSLLPFLTGLGVGMFFGYDLLQSTLLGIIFLSASIAVIVPSLQDVGLFKTKIGNTIIVTAVLEDVLSLALLSITLQLTVGGANANISLPLFYMLLVALFISLKYLLPMVQSHLTWIGKQKDSYEHELRLVFVILIGTVLLFESIGLEPIIAGFFTGLVLSSSLQNEALRNKLHALGYGFFIPIFFVTIGSKIDPAIIIGDQHMINLVVVVVIAALVSKFTSGFLGGRLSGFSIKDSTMIAAATIPHLSTALAVIFTGYTLGIIDHHLLTAMMIVTLISTLIGPILIGLVPRLLK
jgi:Kef-type K+ transport system membrane component KefB